jgi:tRNA 2-(methylsulfanyl)-N6-isopentenyladenosine37 hydroxylase
VAVGTPLSVTPGRDQAVYRPDFVFIERGEWTSTRFSSKITGARSVGRWVSPACTPICEAILVENASLVREIPLSCRPPEGWSELALRDPLALLNDHAYLEKKAATNALELLNRWPEPSCPQEWTITLAAIASDEVSHLSAVVRILVERGGRLERTHRNDYANRLRLHVRKGRGTEELVDRLLISALIELRSCERFELLAQHCRGRDATLYRFYRRLGRSELGHYHVFLRLASLALRSDMVEARWREMLDFEAAAIAAQPPGPRIHSGWTVNGK